MGTSDGSIHHDLVEAEEEALSAAIDEADGDPRDVSHAKMRRWLLRLAAGEFSAAPPEPD